MELLEYTAKWQIGCSGSSAANYFWHGKIDETRISDVVRSADWIKASYRNQHDASDYLAFGSPKTTQKGTVISIH